jgi:hypothetical protein
MWTARSEETTSGYGIGAICSGSRLQQLVDGGRHPAHPESCCFVARNNRHARRTFAFVM